MSVGFHDHDCDGMSRYLMNPNMEIMERFGLEYSATEMAEAIAKVLKKSAT